VPLAQVQLLMQQGMQGMTTLQAQQISAGHRQRAVVARREQRQARHEAAIAAQPQPGPRRSGRIAQQQEQQQHCASLFSGCLSSPGFAG
jgi:hypothetical protein